MTAQLLEPVPGWAPGIRALAAAVEETGRRLAAACADLVQLRDGAVWDGPAGQAFGARIATVPTALDRAARRHLCAAGPLREYAEVLEEEQVLVQRCVVEHRDAWERYDVLEDRAYALVVAGHDESSPEMLLVRADQQEQLVSAARAEARRRAAVERLRAADARCAAVLRALSADGLADGQVYRTLRATSGAGHGTGAVAGMPGRVSPHAKLIGVVGDWVGSAADGALLVGYGEGSWTEVGISATASALGTSGSALRAGAKAHAVVRADGVVVPVRALSTQERLLAGAVATARAKIRNTRAVFTLPPERGTPRALLGGSPPPRPAGSALRRVVDAGRRTVRTQQTRLRTELSLVSSGGAPAVRMYAAGVTLQAGAKAVPHLAPPQPAPAGAVR